MAARAQSVDPADVRGASAEGRWIGRSLPPYAQLARRLASAVEREAFVALTVATYTLLLLTNLPNSVGGDGWLVLTAGREIFEHGLPKHDSLTVWANGEAWVDQQWAAQAVFYAVSLLGGMKAALLVNVAVIAGALALALAAARRFGASSRSTAAVGLVCVVVAFPHSGLRAQTFAYPLFAAVVAMLVRDARAPSRGVYLVFPLLVVWANLHGSVVLGAALVVLAGGVAAARRLTRRGASWSSWRVAAMVALPPACVFASPYGPSLAGYYRSTLANSAFADLVGEWQPPTLRRDALFFVLAIATVWLIARYGRRLTMFERCAVLATLFGGLLAVRNIVWFVLVVAIVAPLAVDELWPPDGRRRRVRVNAALGVAAGSAVVGAFVLTAIQPESAHLSRYPERAADAVGVIAGHDRATRVFANERFADWLLWREPRLAGRIAFDVRFELLSERELRAIAEFRGRAGSGWKRAVAGYDILVLDPASDGASERSLLAEEGMKRVYRDDAISILVRAGERG